MNIGDKVTLNKTTETGTITQLLRGDLVEVELEGWNSRQTFSKNELKLLNKTAENEAIAPRKEVNKYEKGVFLAFAPIKLPTGEFLEFYAINNSEWDLPFSITIDKTRSKTGLMAGFLKAGSFQKYHDKLSMVNFEDWKSMTFSALHYFEANFEPKPQLYVQKKFQAATFFQNKKIAPFLEKETYLFQIDEKPIEINAKEIQEKMIEGPTKPVFEAIAKPEAELDLHIENLNKNYKQLGNAEIFATQIDVFEKHLQKAVIAGLHEAVYIHGIGDGKLKKAIHDILEFHPNVRDFGAANAQKYGEGATFVRIK
jgi:DNA-nicking Smr family endonuclease